MIIAAALRQLSLTDPPPTSAINAAVNWVGELLFGPLATVIAVIAIASIGFVMLAGRLDIRRGLWVILGCFLLFGARGIAEGLLLGDDVPAAPAVASVAPPPVYSVSQPAANSANAFDPYAGASVVQTQ
jgi:type IV secretory pathway VirB2 component (pilin)